MCQSVINHSIHSSFLQALRARQKEAVVISSISDIILEYVSQTIFCLLGHYAAFYVNFIERFKRNGEEKLLWLRPLTSEKFIYFKLTI